ncbi:MAG: hypothetical protein IJA02_04130 [Clostridia bacterium]|nr:hypothetical protein [Clostridia bacterium]
MNFTFTFLDKQNTEKFLPQLFEILHSNMSIIAPTGNTYEEDFAMWNSCIFPAIQKENRQIVLIYSDEKLAGYFQYYTTDISLMMEEIQLKKEYHSSGAFRQLYSWLIPKLPQNLQYVEAYSNKQNLKSQKILEHFGLAKCGENKNGNSYYYKGEYHKLAALYKQPQF